MPRLFLALWPDPSTRAALAEASTAVDIRGGLRVNPENLHLTLAFLGQVPESLAARLYAADLTDSANALACEVATAGWWRESRIAWLGLLEIPSALTALRRVLLAELRAQGVPGATEKRPWRPHITLARDVPRAPRVTGSIACTWKVNEFALIESFTEPYSVRYEVRNRWSLLTANGD